MILIKTRIITEFVDGRGHRLMRIEEQDTKDVVWEEQSKQPCYCATCYGESWTVIGRDMTDTRILRLETEYQNCHACRHYFRQTDFPVNDNSTMHVRKCECCGFEEHDTEE